MNDFKPTGEGMRKGGMNEPPTSKRPSPPKPCGKLKNTGPAIGKVVSVRSEGKKTIATVMTGRNVVRIRCEGAAALDLESLIPFQGDLKTLAEEDFKRFRKEIEDLGFSEPISVWSTPIPNKKPAAYYILNGHQRVTVLRRMRTEGWHIPALPISWVDADTLQEAKRKVLSLTSAYGRVTEKGLRDFAKEAGLKLDEIADSCRFPDLDIDKILDRDAKAAANSDIGPQPPPRKPVTKRGDLYILQSPLGTHRVLCGDATRPEDWERLMGGEKADMVHTDPPYGVSYKSPTGKGKAIAGDDKRNDDLVKSLLLPTFQAMRNHAREAAAFYIWHASSTREDFTYAMKGAGLKERQYLIWAKPAAVLGWADYHWQHEPCFYAARDGQTPTFYGTREETTVWRIVPGRRPGAELPTAVVGPGTGVVVTDGRGQTLWITGKKPSTKKAPALRVDPGEAVHVVGSNPATDTWQVERERATIHPTQKPIEIPKRAIENSTKSGQLVVDPFGGSGSTLIAAEIAGRRCCTMEMDPAYCDAIVARWEGMTGLKAIRDGGKR